MAFNLLSVVDLYAYNKNAKYEEELVREEERKLLLKVRRQARRLDSA